MLCFCYVSSKPLKSLVLHARIAEIGIGQLTAAVDKKTGVCSLAIQQTLAVDSFQA